MRLQDAQHADGAPRRPSQCWLQVPVGSWARSEPRAWPRLRAHLRVSASHHSSTVQCAMTVRRWHPACTAHPALQALNCCSAGDIEPHQQHMTAGHLLAGTA